MAMESRRQLIESCMSAFGQAHYAVMFANFGLRGKGFHHPDYVKQLDIIDHAILTLSEAKWLYWRSTGEIADFAPTTGSNDDLKRALELFSEVERLTAQVQSKDLDALEAAATQARDNSAALVPVGRCVMQSGEVPIVPSICPIVVLKGDSVSMGRQYVAQCAALFGAFVFETIAKRSFTDAEIGELETWAEQLSHYAPEVLEFCRGMVQGSQSTSVPFTYHQALFIWTGDSAPAREPVMIGVEGAEVCSLTGYFGAAAEGDTNSAVMEDAPDLCSGFAAWGSAKANDETVVGCSTDHDCSFQATIVAYPDTGHPFIYTPFSVNGSIPGVGRFFMAGHPGVNAAGLAYVHHGGPCGCTEPEQDWGYGVRRGAVNMHNLRFASTLDEALSYQQGLPTGDDGRLMGSAGGFYASADGAYVLESRRGAKNGGAIIRESSVSETGETHSYLYANNNVLSPQAEGLFCPPEGGYEFSPVSGWYTLSRDKIFSGDLGHVTRHMWSASSEPRNRHLAKKLGDDVGQIDVDLATEIYLNGPPHDVTDWPAFEARANAGEKIDASVGTRMNAQVSVIDIPAGRPPTYRLSIGPIAHRSVTPHRAGYGFYYYDETNEMWELVLHDTPREMATTACETARSLYSQCEDVITHTAWPADSHARLSQWRDEAGEALTHAEDTLSHLLGEGAAPDVEVAHFSDILCAATRAQVRARQILTAQKTAQAQL